MNKGFRFKQFSVEDNGCGMPVSTDGVLLGAWAEVGEYHSVLDIGTGTGLLTLMVAQRVPTATIFAIDIDEHAVKTAQHNTACSPWSSRITVLHQDITTWESTEKFDTIICNPPYFTSGEQANDARRATARHTDTLSHEMILKVIKARLYATGKAHLILPSIEADKLIACAINYGLYCHQLTDVLSTPIKSVSRRMITLSPLIQTDCEKETLIIQDKGMYTASFIALTKDFYLKM